jgi:hypothetical protein
MVPSAVQTISAGIVQDVTSTAAAIMTFARYVGEITENVHRLDLSKEQRDQQIRGYARRDRKRAKQYGRKKAPLFGKIATVPVNALTTTATKADSYVASRLATASAQNVQPPSAKSRPP